VIGKIEKGVYIASGHSCWGICNGELCLSALSTYRTYSSICLGPGTGKVMAEILLDGKASSADVSDLSP